MYVWTLAIAVLLAVDIAALPQDAFQVTKECENDLVCMYGYQAMQEDFKGDLNLTTTVSTTVLVSCDAVGEYAGRTATRYCLTSKDTDMFFRSLQEESSGPFFDSGGSGSESGNGSGDDGQLPQGTADRLLAGWFCFVQTDNGKVVAVYHSRDDLLDIVHFKEECSFSIPIQLYAH